jgi:hypothetical protein
VTQLTLARIASGVCRLRHSLTLTIGAGAEQVALLVKELCSYFPILSSDITVTPE